MPPSTTEAGQGLRLSVVHPDPQARAAWRQALQSLLPAAQVREWAAAAQGSDRSASALATGVSPGPGGTPGAHYGVGWRPPAAFFADNPDLAAFLAAGAGIDHLLALPGLPPALPIVRLEDAGMADQMFRYCLHEALRRLHHEDDYRAQQRAGGWQELPARAPADLRVGIVGLGALGGAVATRLAALGFPVSGFARGPRALPGVRCRHGAAQWPAFLAEADLLVLMAPLTPETRDLIDAAALAALPREAWLVNVARGELIDDDALLAALDAGQLAGATLDVFRIEPLPAGHAFRLHPRIRLTPHVAAQTLIAPGARQVADKILRLQQGLPTSGIVQRARGY